MRERENNHDEDKLCVTEGEALHCIHTEWVCGGERDRRHVTKCMTSYLFLLFSCVEVDYLYVGLVEHITPQPRTSFLWLKLM